MFACLDAGQIREPVVPVMEVVFARMPVRWSSHMLALRPWRELPLY